MKTIQEIRKLTGLSQSEFCRALNIPAPTIKKWEQGQRECPPYVVELIAYRVMTDPSINPNAIKPYADLDTMTSDILATINKKEG